MNMYEPTFDPVDQSGTALRSAPMNLRVLCKFCLRIFFAVRELSLDQCVTTSQSTAVIISLVGDLLDDADP